MIFLSPSFPLLITGCCSRIKLHKKENLGPIHLCSNENCLDENYPWMHPYGTIKLLGCKQNKDVLELLNMGCEYYYGYSDISMKIIGIKFLNLDILDIDGPQEIPWIATNDICLKTNGLAVPKFNDKISIKEIK